MDPITETVTSRSRTEEVTLAVTGAPPIEAGAPWREIFQPTGLRLTYRDGELTDARVPTTTDELFLRLGTVEPDPIEDGWVLERIERYRPLTPATAVDRIADALARHYDGYALAELREEHAAHHREAATALLPLLGLDGTAEQPEPVVTVHAAADLSPAAGEALGALIDVAKRQAEEAADPCMPHQRYRCGHCRHTDCPNPDCGHCPCKCDCR